MLAIAKPRTTLRHKLECSAWYELKARCKPLLEAYHRDLLVSDRRRIIQHWGVPYLHWTRPTGTSLEHLHSHNSEAFPAKGIRIPYLFGTADRDHVLRSVSLIAETEQRMGSSILVQHFDGHSLKVIDYKTAIEIAHKHVRMVRYAWANGDK